MTKKSRSKWFLLNRNLHRDLGYLAVALTIVFAVSGIALNHRDDWNPNYVVERQQQAIKLKATLPENQLNSALLEQFLITQPVKASYWESVNSYKLFFDGGGTLTANFKTKLAVFENVTERKVFKQFNTLHLNEIDRGWIIFSDIYAGILLFLAISGLFMIRGKNSPWSRSKSWLLILGAIVPAVYILFILNVG